MVEEFIEDETGFMNWCKENSNGFVINVNGKTLTTNSTNKIHRQSCHTLNDARYVGRMTLPEHPKYCHNDLTTLKQKADRLETAWEFCGSCMREYKFE
jgi:hypothetical protein